MFLLRTHPFQCCPCDAARWQTGANTAEGKTSTKKKGGTHGVVWYGVERNPLAFESRVRVVLLVCADGLDSSVVANLRLATRVSLCSCCVPHPSSLFSSLHDDPCQSSSHPSSLHHRPLTGLAGHSKKTVALLFFIIIYSLSLCETIETQLAFS